MKSAVGANGVKQPGPPPDSSISSMYQPSKTVLVSLVKRKRMRALVTPSKAGRGMVSWIQLFWRTII